MQAKNFAVVGGGIRGRIYARTIQQHPGAHLVGICETNPSRAAGLEAEFGVPARETLEDLLAIENGADAAVVATPDFAHRKPVVEALQAGLDVLVEKPLALTLEDAEAIREEVAANGRRLVVGFENRWNPLFVGVRRELRESGARLISQRSLLQDTTFVPTQMLGWAALSSPAWFLMPHSLDIAMWLSDAEPVEAYARGVKRFLPSLGVDTYDRISASFALSDGSILDLDSGWVQPAGKPSVFEFRHEIEAEGAAYALQIDDTGAHRYTADGTFAFAAPDLDHRGRTHGPPAEMMRDFIDAVCGEDLDLPDIEQGLKVTRALVAVHRALETNEPQKIHN